MQNTNWWRGEPIWITAQKQGLRSATCFWPGSDVPIGGTRPTYWLPFDATLPNEKRVTQIIDWLSLPKETRPQLLTLYIGDVDEAGHRFGPDSPEVEAALRVVDQTMGLFFAKLKAIGREDFNVIIVSDHGMTESSRDRTVVLDDYIDTKEYFGGIRRRVVLIYPPPIKRILCCNSCKKFLMRGFTRRNRCRSDFIFATVHGSRRSFGLSMKDGSFLRDRKGLDG